MILRKGKSFEKFSVVHVVILVMLVLESLFAKWWPSLFLFRILEPAVLKVGTAKCDFKEIVFKYIHRHKSTENSIVKR